MVVASDGEVVDCDESLLVGRSNIHSLVSCDLVPVMIMSLVVLSRVVIVVASKMAMQPASHNMPIDISAWVCSCGNRCTSCASASKEGMHSLPWWDDLIS